MSKIKRLICQMAGHKFTWKTKLDRDGFRCARCNRLVRSQTGKEAKIRNARCAALNTTAQ
ncbi:hypothetical protein FHT86_002122 [Rhizobium sp. BK313]|nr:hypothetical protein [Rhizobium sp. BK313]